MTDRTGRPDEEAPMIRRFRSHMRDQWMGALALFLVLTTGTAWAALGANTVGSKQIKPRAVHSSDIARNAVNSAKVTNRSLRAADFAAGQLPAGEQGSQGPAGGPGAGGAQGPAGARGPQGLAGASGQATGPAGGALAGSYPNPTIAANAVASAQIAGDSILGGDIFNGTIGTNDIGDGEVRGADIASNTILSGNIFDGTIGTADIASNTILGGHIVNGTVGTNDIGDGEVRGVDIASDFNHAYTASGTNPLSVSVPAGQYVVVGQASVYSPPGNGRQNAVCSLQGQVMVENILEEIEQETVPINSTATLASPGNITIACGGSGIDTFDERLTVIRVNGIN